MLWQLELVSADAHQHKNEAIEKGTNVFPHTQHAPPASVAEAGSMTSVSAWVSLSEGTCYPATRLHDTAHSSVETA